MPVSSRPWFQSLSLGLGSFLLYAFTGARTIQWQDSAQFTYRISSGTLWNEYGLAMVHPLHFWLGRLMLRVFPGPDPWAVSLVSALGGAVAVALVFRCVLHLSQNRSASFFAALTLMLAHSFWRFSGLPEVYTLSAALMLAQVWCYLRQQQSGRPEFWWMLFFLNGLALANHNLALLSLSVWGISFLCWAAAGAGRWKHLWAIGGAWGLGSLPYTFLVLLEMTLTGDPAAVMTSALFGHGFVDQVAGIFPDMKILLISLGFMLLSFPGLALPLAGRAVIGGGKTGVRIPAALWILCLLHLLFFLRYNVIDQYTFLIPVYGLLAMFAGLGFAGVKMPLLRKAAWLLLLLQPMLYTVTPPLLRNSGILSAFERQKPYRDDYDYLFSPWQVQERSAARLMTETFDAVGTSGAIVVEDSMAFYSAAWMRMYLGREDVRLLRPEDLLSLKVRAGSVWVPARSDLPPLEGWERSGMVWVRALGAEDVIPSPRW